MYEAKPEGTNYAIFFNGQRISTTSAGGLANYGLSPTQLTSSTPAPTAIGSQVTQQTTTTTPNPNTGNSGATQQTTAAQSSGGLTLVPGGVGTTNPSGTSYYTPNSGFDTSNLRVGTGSADQGEYIGEYTIDGASYMVSGRVGGTPIFYPLPRAAIQPIQLTSTGSLIGQPAQTGVTDTSGGSTPTAGTQGSVPNQPDPAILQQLESILSAAGLDADQTSALREFFGVVATNDAQKAAKMITAFQSGIEYSSPIFKAQVALVADALKEGLANISGNLALKESSLNTQIQKLTDDLTASSEYLDFNSRQELENLRKNLEQDKETLVQNMAAVGKTSSSVRTRAEALQQENYEGLVESSNRKLAYTKSQAERDTNYNVTQSQNALAQLKLAAEQGRIDALRAAEQQLGTSGLTALGYGGSDVLGTQGTPINSELERKKIVDAMSFAGNFF